MCNLKKVKFSSLESRITHNLINLIKRHEFQTHSEATFSIQIAEL